MRIFGNDTHDEDGELVLQCDSLLVGDARWKALQAAIYIENDLVVLGMRFQVFDARHGLHLVRVDVHEQRPNLSPQIVIDQSVIAQSKLFPHIQVGALVVVCKGCFDL